MSSTRSPFVSSLLTSEQSGAFDLPVAKLIEISGDNRCARRTAAVLVLLQAQARGEPAAWVQFANGSLYPPDLHDSGVDLRGVAIVRIPPWEREHGLLKAAEILLRSGGIGLVVVDLGRSSLLNTDTAWQGRLLGLAREHHATVLLMTDKPSSVDSLGPLISLRIEPQRHRQQHKMFTIRPQLLKNKMGLPKPPPQIMRGPWGLR